jgi:hypothetical protein
MFTGCVGLRDKVATCCAGGGGVIEKRKEKKELSLSALARKLWDYNKLSFTKASSCEVKTAFSG